MTLRSGLVALCVLPSACSGLKPVNTGHHSEPSSPSVCDGNRVVADARLALFGDFESGAAGDWYEYHTGNTKVDFTVEPGGANGSHYAAHMVGGPVMGFGSHISYTMKCLDVSRYEGIELWVKALQSSQLQLVLTTPQTLDAKLGGDCRNRCAWPLTEIRVTSEWARYQVPFERFRSFTNMGVQGMVMSLDIHTTGTFDVWIDQVGFYPNVVTQQ